MRCDMCPLWPDGGEYSDNICPEMYGEKGIVHKDGVCGCRHPYNWAKKRDEEYCKYLEEMGETMGAEMEKNNDND